MNGSSRPVTGNGENVTRGATSTAAEIRDVSHDFETMTCRMTSAHEICKAIIMSGDGKSLLSSANGLLIDAACRDDKHRFIEGAQALINRAEHLAEETESFLIQRGCEEVQS